MKICWRKLLYIVPPLVLTMLILIYMLMPTKTVESSEYDVEKKLTNLFVKTVFYLNLTTSDLEKAYYMKMNSSRNLDQDYRELVKEYEDLYQNYFLYNVMSGKYSELVRKLWDAYINYRRLLNTSIGEYNSTNRISYLMSKIEASLDYLKKCSVEEALKIYGEIEPEIHYILNLLKNTLDNATGVDDSKLLNNQHVALKEEAVDLLKKINSSLNRYLEIMRIVEKNKAVYENLCNYINSDQTEPLDEESREMARNIYDQLNNTDFGAATDEANELKIMIAPVIMSEGYGSSGGTGTGSYVSGSPAGGGAGYYENTTRD